jgi:hypothetical protein
MIMLFKGNKMYPVGVPEHIYRMLGMIKYRKEEITRLIRVFPEMADLLRDAPVLAMLLCDERAEFRIPILRVKALLSGPRREICKAVGGFGTKAELNFLLKIRFYTLNDHAVALTRRILGNKSVMDAVKLLHLEDVNHKLLEILLRYPESFTCPGIAKTGGRAFLQTPSLCRHETAGS